MYSVSLDTGFISNTEKQKMMNAFWFSLWVTIKKKYGKLTSLWSKQEGSYFILDEPLGFWRQILNIVSPNIDRVK